MATRTARVGNRRFLRTQRLTETTEDHRGGQRLPHAGRGSESWKLGGLEVWRRFRLSPAGALLHLLYLLNLLKTARVGNRRQRLTETTEDHRGGQRLPHAGLPE